jgi:predicted nucleic acid-binding protein
MPRVICSTSALVYLYRIKALKWLPQMFEEVWVPSDVLEELQRGLFIGLDVPHLFDYDWIRYADPQTTLPSAWLSQELNASDLVAMSLGFEIPDSVILLDDGRARKTGQVAGLIVWGTLRVLLEAKKRGLIKRIAPYVNRLNSEAGMWMSEEIRQRILRLAGEARPQSKEET